MAANTPPPPPPNASGPKPGAPQGQPAPANPDLSGQLAGWRIAAVVLAIIAVIAIIWGIIVNNDLRTQVDSLNAQVAELQKANTAVTEKSQAQATVSQVQIKNLQTEVDQLKDSLTAVGKLSKSTLKAVGTEYSALEQELQESQNQVKALQQQAADSDATSEELAAAYSRRAELHFDLGHYQRAVDSIDQFLRSVPDREYDDPDVRRAYELRGDALDALASLERS